MPNIQSAAAEIRRGKKDEETREFDRPMSPCWNCLCCDNDKHIIYTNYTEDKICHTAAHVDPVLALRPPTRGGVSRWRGPWSMQTLLPTTPMVLVEQSLCNVSMYPDNNFWKNWPVS